MVTPDQYAPDQEGAEVSVEIVADHPYGGRSVLGTYAANPSEVSTFGFALHASSPNPMRNSTTIGFAVPRNGQVRLRVYDVAGRHVRTLIDENLTRGTGVTVWDGNNEQGQQVADGVYFYRLEAGAQSETRKLLLVR